MCSSDLSLPAHQANTAYHAHDNQKEVAGSGSRLARDCGGGDQEDKQSAICNSSVAHAPVAAIEMPKASIQESIT